MKVRRSPTRGKERPQRPRPAQKRLSAESEGNFPVVAIGASAGGLEAFRTLLTTLPSGSGMAFILIQHLDPSHPSMMVDLLSPHSAMPVTQVREGMRLESNHVYINPPGHYLAVREGVLRLSPSGTTQAVRMPFDFLLNSLAREFGDRAVCIILSGTATDGSVGAKAIKGVGGLVIAQDPEEAHFDGMPRSAIAAGAVDLVLPLAKIPKALAKYGGHRYVKTEPSDAHSSIGKGTTKIIELLRKKASHDFALYKDGTIRRRIERRMAMAGIEDSDRYLDLLTTDPAELHSLDSDLFINVTRFFRDAAAFELLGERIVPELVRTQPPDRPIRIWVAGCSTGEEAYSIGILFLEEIARAQNNLKLQIFASDIDEDAITFARAGLYSRSIEIDVSPARLTRFFTKADQGYRVSQELREAIIFSHHDVITDAPFSRIDLVSCRNLLIYLRPAVQQKIIALFHFAVREGGILFLGSSESVGSASDNFKPISNKQGLYRHIGRSRRNEMELPLGGGEVVRSRWLRPVRTDATSHTSVEDLAQRLLLESYAPASVLANEKYEGLYYFGPTDRYLKMPTGVASQDVLAAAREGLRPAIRAAFQKASEGRDGPVALTGRVRHNGRSVAVTVSARRVESGAAKLTLLSFLDAPKGVRKPNSALGSPKNGPSRTRQVARELDTTREELESAVRDRETLKEEIAAIHEEAMFVAEEFQSTTEELETSKEELQSLNEELTALNSQLQETVEQHKATANDLENILNSADVATIFLDEELNIRFFTPTAKALFSVIASDIGRPLADLAHHFADGTLLIDARTVLTNLIPITRDVVAGTGGFYTCRILPYRTKDNRIEGVVITFTDVTVRKQAEDAMKAAKLAAENANLGKSTFLAAASHDLRQPLQTLTLLNALLSRKLKDRDERQLVARSAETLVAMSGMLNTLLDINQLEAGVVRPEIVDFPINDLLGHLKSEYVYHTQARALAWRVLPCRLAVRSDPRLLKQILRNLLSNAVKYTDKGRILLGCRRRGDKLRIEIWDTGIGIPQEQLRAIFREFHQVDNPARDRARGLGLGLAIVQRLADLLGHAIDVRSRPGKGSVFSIDVPLAPEGSRLSSERVARTPEQITPHTGSILIVEDDPFVRDSLEVLLRAEGHRTTVAATSNEAITLVARKDVRPDVVIADYNLPEVNGLELTTRLRGMLGRDLPVLILTGDISTKTFNQISAQDVVHRSKPIEGDDLNHLIQSLLAKPQ